MMRNSAPTTRCARSSDRSGVTGNAAPSAPNGRPRSSSSAPPRRTPKEHAAALAHTTSASVVFPIPASPSISAQADRPCRTSCTPPLEGLTLGDPSNHPRVRRRGHRFERTGRRPRKSLRTWRMSRPASREKLATTMSTLLLHVERDTDPPTGWVRDADGIQHGFAGWLGLMRVLEDHLRSDCEDAAQANPKGGA